MELVSICRGLSGITQKRVSGWVLMNALVVALAQYLPFLIAAAATLIWIYLPRQDKVALVVQAIVSLVIAFALIKVAAAIHTDPRPFVVDPSIKPLFAHPADNGFPSDRTALATTVALLVMMYRRWLGAALLAAAMVVGAARVAAHVHHAQDIFAGMLIAALAVSIASATWRWLRPRLPQRLTEPAPA